MSFPPTWIITVFTSFRGEHLDREAVTSLTVAPGKVHTWVPPLRSSLRLSTFLRLESPIRRVCTCFRGRRRRRISLLRNESFLCCFVGNVEHSCSGIDGRDMSCAEAESDSLGWCSTLVLPLVCCLWSREGGGSGTLAFGVVECLLSERLLSQVL